MATPEQSRQRLRNAFTQAANVRGLAVTNEVVELFLERAVRHIDARYISEANRDRAVIVAEENIFAVMRKSKLIFWQSRQSF